MWKFAITMVLLFSSMLPVLAEDGAPNRVDRPDLTSSTPIFNQFLDIFRGNKEYEQQLQQERDKARQEQQAHQKEVEQKIQQSRIEAQNKLQKSNQELEERNQQIRQETQSEIQNFQQAATGTQFGGQIRVRIQELRGDAAQEVLKNRQAFEREMQQKREEFQKELEAKKVKAEQTRTEQQAQFKEQVAKLKDTRKQDALTRINEEVNNLNKRLTGTFSSILDQLNGVLANIASRADKATAGGGDATAVRVAITNAQNDIAGARTAVTIQAGKMYPIIIESDTTAKSDVGAVRNALHADLSAVRDTVRVARDAVHNAANALAGIPGVDSFHLAPPTAPKEESTSTQ
ncbi:MAG: hypothetical protein UW92_C0033G0002 [Candidatus Jorgensenbacteria bacterium GW2011_GWA2_45_13]|uniref:Uncharacterized protein n=1 Tax=Candidatus Jorgensenbacteria bacterium GW2011_GWA2_45_13 TaxID=1618662 RepID=A0A0G1NBW0_9BACT|nr:MAG: hypothetical protein UW92_C0033G0002 [Candidatus Jorgensenbacteria bacterium GW2011_GWA2_45_13]